MKARIALIVLVGWLLPGIAALRAAAPAGSSGAAGPAHRAAPAAGQQTGSQVGSRTVHAASSLLSHYVMAVYFHRTHRCPTCRMIGSCIEQAVQQAFAKELQQGLVQFRLIDFQAQQNATIAAAYQITGPTLVVIDVRNGRVTAWQPMPQVWSLLARKDDFFRYVQGGVRRYLEQQ